jgi:pimeloyl-ACP methyl ester carboxylesterase
LHGFMGSSAVWQELANDLSKRYKVICIDLPGHGQTPSYGYIHDMELMAGCVDAVLKKLRLRRVALVGHSMGGYVSLAFAELFPDKLKGLCLLNSHASADTEEAKNNRDKAIRLVKKSPEKYIEESVPNWFGPKYKALKKNKINFFRNIALKTSKRGIINALEGMKARNEREIILNFATYPVHFIGGKEDALIPLEKIVAQSELPKIASLKVLDNSGHIGFAEAKDETIESIKGFLKKAFKK